MMLQVMLEMHRGRVGSSVGFIKETWFWKNFIYLFSVNVKIGTCNDLSYALWIF